MSRRIPPDWPFKLPEEWGEAGRQLFYLKFQSWLDDVATGRARWGNPNPRPEVNPENRKAPARPKPR